MFLMRLCKNKYAPIVGFLIFSVSGAIANNGAMRYQWALPQEYAMLFLYPCAIYLINYLESKEVSKFDLIGYGACFSLTLAIHYYITIVAALLSLAIWLFYLPGSLTRFKRFGMLALALFLSLVVAVLPLGIGYMQGIPPEGSLQWALGIINQGSEEYVEEEVVTEEDGTVVEDTGFVATLTHKLGVMRKAAHDYLISSVTLPPWYDVFVALYLLTLLGSAIGLIFRRTRNYSRNMLGICLYVAMLVLITQYPGLGYPALMEGSRACIFICYALGIFYVYPVELISGLLSLWKISRRLCSAWALAVAAAITGVMYLPATEQYGYRARSLPYYMSFQYPEVITLLYDLYSEYPTDNWTLISSLMETQLTYSHGWHYDMYSFLSKQRYWTKESVLTLPTKYIFVYIEKEALEYPEAINQVKGRITSIPISPEYAARALPRLQNNKMTGIYSDNRPVLMSRLWYWAQEAMELYAPEMRVYFETDRTVCYIITQDPACPLNLAINYGFNVRNEVSRLE